jgi:hypothetical protein
MVSDACRKNACLPWNHWHQPAMVGLKVETDAKIFWSVSGWTFCHGAISKIASEELKFEI